MSMALSEVLDKGVDIYDKRYKPGSVISVEKLARYWARKR